MPVRPGLTPLKELGNHVLVDAWDSIKAGGATLIDICIHQFSPHGVTATATLAESHVAIHTWPEHGYFAADLFFCGSLDPLRSIDSIVNGLRAGEVRTRELKRGFQELPRR
jgi:S-adenosylmethionine decarboxylase